MKFVNSSWYNPYFERKYLLYIKKSTNEDDRQVLLLEAQKTKLLDFIKGEHRASLATKNAEKILYDVPPRGTALWRQTHNIQFAPHREQ